MDKSRYSAGDNSLEREIQVLLQVGGQGRQGVVLAVRGRLPTKCRPPRSQVDHPNCIKLENVYITPRKVYLVTELVTGGELLDRWEGARLRACARPACAGPSAGSGLGQRQPTATPARQPCLAG